MPYTLSSIRSLRKLGSRRPLFGGGVVDDVWNGTLDLLGEGLLERLGHFALHEESAS